MSNISSDHLHKLIRSLSKPEKRYFKIYSSRHTLGDANNYHLLFDIIDDMDEYQEEKIKKKFHGKPFLKQLSIAKGRLYDAIMRSLDSYHSNSSVDAQLKKLIHCAEILYKKTLYAQSSRVLKSAKKLAIKYEKHTTILEILDWEKKLTEKDNYTETGEKEINALHDEDRLYLEKHKNYVDFWQIKSQLFYILNKKGKARSQQELQDFKSIIDNVLLQSDTTALNYETTYLYYHIYSAYYFGVGDYENSFINLKKNVAHIESNIELFKDEPNVYFSVLTNIIYVGIQLKKYEEAFLYLEKLQSLPEKMMLNNNEDLDIKLFSSTYSIELTIYALTGDFDKGLALVPVIEEGLKLYGEKINKVRKAYLLFNIGILYFGAQNYVEALKWFNKLLNDIDIDKTQDIHCFAQLMNLLVHIELKNQRLLPYAYRSTYRYLQSRNRVYKFENITLHFIGKLMKAKDIEAEEEIYARFAKEIKAIANDDFEKTAFEYFDFLSWAESKIGSRSFKEVVRSKAVVK